MPLCGVSHVRQHCCCVGVCVSCQQGVWRLMLAAMPLLCIGCLEGTCSNCCCCCCRLCTADSSTPLLVAVLSGNVSAVEKLLALGADANLPAGPEQKPAIHVSVTVAAALFLSGSAVWFTVQQLAAAALFRVWLNLCFEATSQQWRSSCHWALTQTCRQGQSRSQQYTQVSQLPLSRWGKSVWFCCVTLAF
jgi:hypothetical protein